MAPRRPSARAQQADFVGAVFRQRDAARREVQELIAALGRSEKQLALVRELACNYAEGLLSADTAMDAVAAAVLSGGDT